MALQANIDKTKLILNIKFKLFCTKMILFDTKNVFYTLSINIRIARTVCSQVSHTEFKQAAK